MEGREIFDVVIVGGSYAGLAAAMALGRSLRKVLVIDSNEPCNKQAPHSQNFLTRDGEKPQAIRSIAQMQVQQYPTVVLLEARVVKADKSLAGFAVVTDKGEEFQGLKILFATGVKDLLPEIDGFAACWGISVLHCPYCHGYEVSGQKIGVIGNGNFGFEYARLIYNWSKDLVLFTHGAVTLAEDQVAKLKSRNIAIIEKNVIGLKHKDGYLKALVLADGSNYPLTALFAKVAFEQHCSLLQALGCEINESGLIKVDDLQQTTVPGVYAAGDNVTPLRALAMATAAGTKAGAFINKALIEELF